MTNQTFISLDAEDEVANGDSFPPRVGFGHMSVQVNGMVTNDIVQVQASNDGTNYEPIGDDISADGIYAVELGAVEYRAAVTDVSGGGTITATFAGFSS
jgi:hypothetical protein